MRSLYLFFLSLFSLGVAAQECLPTALELSTSIENNGTLFMEWSLNELGGETISSGGNLFNAEVNSVPFSACLLPGCYQLVAEADGMIPPISTWLSVEVSNGFVNEYDYSIDGNTYIVNFCVTENSECVLAVDILESPSCDVIQLAVTEFNPNAQLFWTVNDEPVSASTSLSFEATEPGSYQICVGYETPDCPQGEFWCETFIITPACIEGIDCSMTLDVNQEDCGNFSVVATVPSGWQNVSWTLNGEPYNDLLVWTQNFDLPDGEYEICASFESPACGFVSECVTVVVNCNSNACELDVAIFQLDCSPVSLAASGNPGDAVIDWFVDGVLAASATADFEFSPESAGSYQICAQYETPDCPQGVSWCETFTWSEACFGGECPYELFVDLNDCIGVFILDGGIQGPVDFYVDGVLVNNQENVFTYIFDQNGSYEVCAVHEGICDQTEFCQTVEVTGCTQVDPCTLEYTLTQTGCGEYTAEVTQAPPGVDVYLFWLGQVILMEDGVATFEVDVTEVYELCLFFESNDCPDGVFECVEQEFFGCECPDEITGTVDGCLGEFALDGLLSGPGADFFVNGVFVGDAPNWEFAYEFPTNGVYEVCAISNNPACTIFELCTEVEVTECVSCTEVFIEVTANPNAIEEALLLQALIEGIAIDAGIEVLFFELEASLGIGVCLPDGCYELNAELPGVPALDIAVSIGDEVVLEHSFSPANPNVSLEFGINDDCGEGVGDYAAQSIRAYPVPAAQTVTLEWPYTGLTAVVVYDMTGRVVTTQETVVNGRLVLDVSGFASGVYLVQAAGAYGLYSGRIQVNR